MFDKIRDYPRNPLPLMSETKLPDEVIQPLIDFIFGIYSTPGLEEPRQIMHWTMRKIVDKSSLLREEDQKLDRLNGLILYALLDTFGTSFGFGGPVKLPNNTVQKIYPRERFEDLVAKTKEWSELDPISRNGTTLGAYDPPHLGHTLDISRIYPYTSRIMVGVEPNWSIKKRKSKPDDERPRFPYIMWRMWQFAILPMVDAVYEIPIEPNDDPDVFYPDLYRRLNIKIHGTEGNHELIKTYQRNIGMVGGQVIATKDRMSFLHNFINFRSTENMRRLANLYGSTDVAMNIWKEKLSKREQEVQERYDRAFK